LQGLVSVLTHAVLSSSRLGHSDNSDDPACGPSLRSAKVLWFGGRCGATRTCRRFRLVCRGLLAVSAELRPRVPDTSADCADYPVAGFAHNPESCARKQQAHRYQYSGRQIERSVCVPASFAPLRELLHFAAIAQLPPRKQQN
jgi:hypothetical protein